MKRTLVLIAILVSDAAFAAAADKQLLGLMMPDAKVLAGVNVLQARNSPYGQFLLSQIPVGDAHFQQFVRDTGFDPTRDVTEIVAASADVQGAHKGLVAARGAFDVGQIVAFSKRTGGTVDQSIGSVTVIASPDGQMGIALLDPTLALLGDLNSVVGAVARRNAPATLDAALSGRADLLSANNDAWVVSIMPVPPVTAGQGPAGLNLAALQTIQQASAGVKFGTSVNVNAEAIADTPQNANALADVARLLVGLAQMNQADPKAAQFAAVLKTISIQTNGSAIQIGLAIPEDLVEQLGPNARPRARHRRVAAVR
jgi:hypothetical protein